MCFSASASFAAGAVLVPLGGYTLFKSWQLDRRYLTIASFPLLFGIQQLFEGRLWLALADGGGPRAHGAAMGFLLFAFFLWLILVPLAAFFVEADRTRRALFLLLALAGGLFGLSLYAPLLADRDWLSIGIARHSITYNARLIYDGIVPTNGLRLIYAAIICLPLIFSSVPSVRIFGLLLALSVAAAFFLAAHAFTSVWCFMAAGLSVYVALIVGRLHTVILPPAGTAHPSDCSAFRR